MEFFYKIKVSQAFKVLHYLYEKKKHAFPNLENKSVIRFMDHSVCRQSTLYIFTLDAVYRAKV